jgi:hypothetical protein
MYGMLSALAKPSAPANWSVRSRYTTRSSRTASRRETTLLASMSSFAPYMTTRSWSMSRNCSWLKAAKKLLPAIWSTRSGVLGQRRDGGGPAGHEGVHRFLLG